MNSDFLVFNSRDEMLRIKVKNIVYFESDGNYTHMVTQNRLRPSLCMSLGNMEKLLALKLRDKASMFIRVGRRYIINRNFIYMVSPIKQRLVLSDFVTFAYQLDVSKDALSRMKSLLTEISKQK